ncbi:MAG: LLM class F420-dependent oxidoreductase [Ilumatobacteraceae bacterium]
MRIGYTTMNTPADLSPRELAPLLESAGFDSLWIGEHSHIPVSRRTPYPTGGEMPWQYTTMMDPFVSLAIAAEHSRDLRLGLGVVLPLEHDIFVLAKKTATLDLLSEGRVEFGVGAGWNVEELHDHRPEIEWSQRYLAVGESVDALRALWTDDEAAFHGRWFDFDAVWCRPKPAQKPTPRVWYGTGGKVGTRHAVERADGWLPLDVTLGNVSKFVGRFRESCRAAGRGDLPISMVAFGDPSLDTLLAYRDLGIERVVVGSGREGWEDPSGVTGFIHRYAAMVERLL